MNSQDIHAARILLIEDEEIMVKLLQKRLERAGYQVDVAQDGVTGVEKIVATHPDLVLLDMILPRLNGFGVLEQLTSLGVLPGIPVIVISNSGQQVEIDQALKLGVRDYLVKVDFDPDELLAKVEHIFPARPGASAEPVKTDSQEPASTASPPQIPSTPLANILLVEDDVLLGDLLARKLEQQNYRVLRAIDATKARQTITNDTINIILLDIILPGMDGVSFLEEIHETVAKKHIPVLMLSNLSQREMLERSMKAGAADFIVKANVTIDDIVRRIGELLAKPLPDPSPPVSPVVKNIST